MKKIASFSLLSFFAVLLISQVTKAQTVRGDLHTWHKVVIDFSGPNTSEKMKPNPFTDYRMDVTFTGPSNQVYKVPGFYAADGHAAETSSDSGNVWRVNFAPDEAGTWSFSTSFVTGTDIAAQLEGGESAGFFDNSTGNFEISDATDLDSKDFRSKGKLVYVNDHYLQFKGTGEYFLKAGANSPEVFLEYSGFDNTPSNRTYPNHIADYVEGEDSLWQDDQGKGIVGAINYLSKTGVNALYFLTMNAYGDGKNAWPWIHQDSIKVYDVSKLEQWEIVFEHMTKKGVMPHFVLTETENEAYFELVEDGSTGGFATSRKIYYREMVARFGHHPAVTWNIGEENGWEDPSGSIYKTANTDQQRIEASDYVRALTYYNDHITIHNGPSTDDYIYDALLGVESHTGPAFQWNYGPLIHDKILEWRNKSTASGHKWVVNMDEAWLGGGFGLVSAWRTDMVWGTFMAGGAGVELYVGSGKDLTIQDFRIYELYYLAVVETIDFLKTNNIPFHKMEPSGKQGDKAYILAEQDSTYLMYFPKGGSTDLALPEGIYDIKWFDLNTADFYPDSEGQIIGGDTVVVGPGPGRRGADQAALITRADSLNTSSEVENYKPTGFNLEQNYPNPFNPSTRITYSIEKPIFVSLKVYDSVGRVVDTLVNGFKNPSSYQVSFNASSLSSGVYYYRLKAGSELITRKMLLMK